MRLPGFYSQFASHKNICIIVLLEANRSFVLNNLLIFYFNQTAQNSPGLVPFQILDKNMRLPGFEPGTPALSELCATWLRYSLI